jgi:GST-like protein
MITLYSFPTPNGQKASIMLEEVGLPYRVSLIDITVGEQFQPPYLEISPLGKIPGIVDEDAPDGPQRVFGSGAILLYLAEKTGLLMPAAGPDRAEALSWIAFGVSDLAATSIDLFRFMVRAPEKLPYAIELFKGELKRCYAALEMRLAASEYLAGAAYSAADIACFPFVAIAVENDSPVVENASNVRRWHAAIAARPAVQLGRAAQPFGR